MGEAESAVEVDGDAQGDRDPDGDEELPLQEAELQDEVGVGQELEGEADFQQAEDHLDAGQPSAALGQRVEPAREGAEEGKRNRKREREAEHDGNGAAEVTCGGAGQGTADEGTGAAEADDGQRGSHEEDADQATAVRLRVHLVGPAGGQLDLKGAQEAHPEDDEQQEQEEVEVGVRGNQVQHVHPEHRRQQQAQAGVDEDDAGAVDEGVADALCAGLALLGEEAHRHRNQREHARREQGRKAEAHAEQEEDPQAVAHLLFFGFSDGPRVTRAELRNGLCAGVIQGEVEFDVRREDALRVVARHVGEQAVDFLGTVSGPAHLEGPPHGALERLDILVEVGVVMDLGRAFAQVPGLHAFRGDGEGGGNRSIERVVVVAVDVPPLLDDRCGDEGGGVVRCGVQGDVPLNGVVEAHGRVVLGVVHPERTVVPAMASAVATPTVIGLGAFGPDVRQRDVEVDVLRRQALAFVADHEGQVAFHRLGNRSWEGHRVHPVHVFLEEEQIEHEVGVVLEDGLALRGRRVGRLHTLGLDGERGGNRPVEGVQELAVHVPAGFDRGMEIEVEAAVSIVIQGEVPFHGIVDLRDGRDGRSEGEEQGEEEMQGLHGHVALRAGR